jgi:2-polyprenyl-3-methyl-5-hydroxy-6-metoxy-1,4-benzoquinol methylase
MTSQNGLHPPASDGGDPAVAPDRDRLAGMEVLRTHRVGVLIVAYDAERHIGPLLSRIDPEVARLLAEIYVIDDSSRDSTVDAATAAGAELGLSNVHVYRTPFNQGYGGNQKVGYVHAIERGHDIVVLLHGDGQYPPERLPEMLAPFADEATDAVLGSRMMRPRDALRGGMPFYKWIGNQMLTWFENRMLRTRLAEFHTGFRAYRVPTLRRVPFKYNSNDFHFDTDILIQLISGRRKIVEVPIPTHYGDEVCHVNGMRYAWQCAASVTKFRLFQMGLLYNPFLDFSLFDTHAYFFKHAANSLHQHVLQRHIEAESEVLDLGASTGYVSAEIARKAAHVVAVDMEAPQHAGDAETLALDLDGEFDTVLGRDRFDTVVVLDVIEHLNEPELAIQRIARVLRPGGKLVASTANISYFVMRALLLLGMFNYGKRGILDRTHKRLFTVRSFRRMLETYGFDNTRVRGFGPPIRDLISRRWPFSWADSLLGFLARVWPGLFAYNFLIVASRRPMLDEIYQATVSYERGPSDGPTQGDRTAVHT